MSTKIIGAGMDFSEIQQYVHKNLPLTKYDPKKFRDNPLERASEFFMVLATLNDFKQRCEADKAKIQTMSTGFYHDAYNSSSAKSVTQQKLDAEIDAQYSNTRETLEEIDSMIKWTKTSIDIFNNAHLTFRQLAKDL